MAIDLITGHQGVAHISAEQIAELQRAELGGYGDNKVMRMIDGGVTYAGLTITVAAGYWRVNGYDMQIQEAEEILIDPTAAGMSRIDKVYASILQDIPSGVQRSELRVVQGEESASTPTAPTKPTAPILNTDELLQIEEVCTVTVSDGAMTFTDETIPYELANPEDITDTQEMIAPIEAGPTASKAYAKGKQLIYNGLLYKVTTAIAQGDTLTVGTNIALSDDVVTQLETLTKNAPKYGTSSSSASTTAKTATTTNGDFNLHTGSVVRVKFTYTNTATTPTLNVDSTGAHNIKAYNTTKPDVYWKAGDVVEFTYDGSNFIMGATEGQISELNASLANKEDKMSYGTGTLGSHYFIIGDILVCYGAVHVGGSGSTSAAMREITYPHAFSELISIIATPINNNPLSIIINAYPTSYKLTKCQLYSVKDNAWYTGGIDAYWVAIGKV